jgi:hypothetical protein
VSQTVPTRFSTDKDREFRCPECGNRWTRGLSGTEYGHERGTGENGAQDRCSRRPRTVDPRRCAPDHDDWQSAES